MYLQITNIYIYISIYIDIGIQYFTEPQLKCRKAFLQEWLQDSC